MRRWPFLADYQARLSREGNPRPVEREAEASEHHEVGVQSNTGQSANAERREAVVVLEPTEFALDGRTASVEVAEPLSVARRPYAPLPLVRRVSRVGRRAT